MFLVTTLTLSFSPRVLVTGATGKTGAPLYAQLKADPRVAEVRALVRNATKAREVLNCSACDETEGIYIGDVTQPETLAKPMQGVDTLAIAIGVGGGVSQAVMKAVEFTGVENQVRALASQNVSSESLRVVFCSSMGTTNPNPPPFEGGPILFWKLNAEAFLAASGIGATTVKPCGLSDDPAGTHRLAVSHDDKLPGLGVLVPRADVAAVMVEAVVQRSQGLRFLLCTARGPPMTDLSALLDEARWPWQA